MDKLESKGLHQIKTTSKKVKETKIDEHRKEELNIPQTLRSEFHFLKFPFFNLCTRQSKINEIEVLEEEKTEEGKIEIWWRVSRNVNTDFPSSFARRLHKKVIEKSINSMDKPIYPLVKLGSLRQICTKMNIVESGENLKEIKKALRDIKAATIDVKGTFRKKEKNGIKKFFEGIFSLYDMVFFTGETLPDGTKADAVYVLLNDMYVQNFNNNFVVPLDYKYLQSINGDIASRMYEVFSVWFYPALENGKQYIQKKYSEICSYFPLTRQNVKWKARGQLKSAHQQHIANSLLASEPEWIDINEKDDWLIRYYIGTRARDWYKQNKRLENIDESTRLIENPKTTGVEENKLAVTQIEEITTDGSTLQNKDDQSQDKQLLSRLISLDISAKKAVSLISSYSSDIIELWIDAVSTIKPDNPPGFLIQALEEGWALPKKFKKKLDAKEFERDAALKEEYNKFLIAQVETYLETYDQSLLEKEREESKRIFMDNYGIDEIALQKPCYETVLDQFYKQRKAKILDLISFEDWKKEYQETKRK